MHMKRASVVAIMAGLSNAADKRADSPAVIEHVYLRETTSTIYSTSTSTIIACGPTVTNCPASSAGGVVTSVAPAYVTVCPYTSISTETPSSAGNGPAATVTHQDTATVTASPTSTPFSTNTADAVSQSATSSSASSPGQSASTPTGVTANPFGTTSSDSTTFITVQSTKLVTQFSTVTLPGGSETIVPVPASPPSYPPAYTANTAETANPVGTSSTTNTANSAAPASSDSGSIPFTYNTPTSLAATVTSSTNAVGAVGATGTGSIAPTNGTLSTPTMPPTSSLVPFEGSAQGIKGGFAGLLIAAAAFLI